MPYCSLVCHKADWKRHKPTCGQLLASVEVAPIPIPSPLPPGLRNALARQLDRISSVRETHPGAIWTLGSTIISVPPSSPLHTSLLHLRAAAINASLTLGTGDEGFLPIATFFYPLRNAFERQLSGLKQFAGSALDDDGRDLASMSREMSRRFWEPLEVVFKKDFELSDTSMRRVGELGEEEWEDVEEGGGVSDEVD